MRVWTSSRLAWLVSALGLLATVPIGLAAQSVEEGSRRVELEQIRTRVEALDAELAELDRVGGSVEAELRRLDLESRLQRQMVAEATAERALAEESLRSSTERIESLEATVSETRVRLARRIVALYKAAPVDWLRGFVEIRTPSDVFLYLRTLRFLARRDARLLPLYLRQQAELEAEQEQLERREQEVARSVVNLRTRLKKLAAARRKQALVVRALDKERRRLENQAEVLDDKERKLALLITVLADPDEASLAGAPIQEFRGVLDWPLEGTVTVPFGPRYESRYGTRLPHNGIQIEPVEESIVRAAFPGVVIFAAPFEGFGLTVVVHHRLKVFSLHAGLEELIVAKDDVVALGQALGKTRAPLYFEIRVENRPEDPIEWLR